MMTTAEDPSTLPRADPRGDYARHLETRRASLVVSIAQHVRAGNLRVAIVAFGLTAAYAVFARGLFSWWWLLVPAAAFFWAGGPLERAVKARARFGRAVAFYERALARLDGRWAGAGSDPGARFLDDAHLYARDLDLFGEASLF